MKKLNWNTKWYYPQVSEGQTCKIKGINISIGTVFRRISKFVLKNRETFWNVRIQKIYLDHKKFKKRYQAKRFVNQIIRLIMQLFPNYDFNWKIPQDRELSLNEIVFMFSLLKEANSSLSK
jgi:hypothetical protein